MKYKFIIIAILIFLKIIGIASHAKADFSNMDWYKDFKEQSEKEHREWVKQWEYNNGNRLGVCSTITCYEAKIEWELKEFFEDTKTITNINHETNKITNRKISKDEEKEKEELILSMTLSTLFNITQL